MNDQAHRSCPAQLESILAETEALGFDMASDRLTGSLLRTLVATKPAGRFLELGTGTGFATAWILDGMDERSHLTSIEQDQTVLGVALKHLGENTKVRFHNEDGGVWLRRACDAQFDLIFADTWPGKYTQLEDALRVLKCGGLYVIDDMLPQPTWPAGHAPVVDELIERLESRSDLVVTKMNWSTGIIVAAKVI
ncbi:MAG: class I SAM-dependent methyltransferase [Pyrinomonadaceae bacterium]|nr:class I SAM-dependent methyltransferase [Pyrinomonadaceae bacterium]